MVGLSMKSLFYKFCMVLCLLILGLAIFPRPSLGSANIVNPGQVYSYSTMERDIKSLAVKYPGLITYKSLGKTIYGRELWAVQLGRGEASLFLNGSHHAREWMTTSLLMKMADSYAQAYVQDQKLGNYKVRDLLNNVSIWIVPMVNPDGVTLAQQGTAGLSKSLASTLVGYNGGSSNFKRWKANMQGLDLNRQYPASWSAIRNTSPYPSYQNYKGVKPAQAPEIRLMMDFTYTLDPEMTISYHSSGEIVFWNFNTLAANLARDKKIAADVGLFTGYSLVKPEKNPSGGGYKDWFIQEFKRPGLTIEIGSYAGEGPLPLSAFNNIWAKNKKVGVYAAAVSYDLWLKKQTLEQVGLPMNLFTQSAVFSGTGNSPAIGTQQPQEVYVIARKGNWFQIKYGSGVGWICPAPGTLAVVETVEATAQLNAQTKLYKYPDLLAPKGGILPPQKVEVKGKYANWLLVSSLNGTWWIDGTSLTLVEAADPTAVSQGAEEVNNSAGTESNSINEGGAPAEENSNAAESSGVPE